MARVTAKQTTRRCVSCGKFLASTSAEDQCEACLSSEADAEAASKAADREIDVTEAPMPPRPETSWPPRVTPRSAPVARQQVPPPPAATPGSAIEPGIVIPRPSQLHPTAVNPVRAALDAPKGAPQKRSLWRLPKRTSGTRPAAKPMQAVRWTTPLAPEPDPPKPLASSQSGNGTAAPEPPRPASGIVLPLAAPEPPRPASGIVLPLAAPEPPRAEPAPAPAPQAAPVPAPTPSRAEPAPAPSATPLPSLSKATGAVLPLTAAPPHKPAPETSLTASELAIAERLAATPRPPARAEPPLPIEEPVVPYDPGLSRQRGLTLSRTTVLMWARVMIAVAIGLAAGLMVPFLLSR